MSWLITFQFIGVQAYVSDRELIELNKLIENFYTQTLLNMEDEIFEQRTDLSKTQ